MTQEQKNIIAPAINTIQTEGIRQFAWTLAEDLPDYIWHIGASTTGKYHPEYTLGEGGLMRHMVATLHILNHMLSLEQNDIGPHTKDLLRVAALFHDGLKCGTQEDYEMNPYTRHDHPILMGQKILSYYGKCPLDKYDLYNISSTIESHMGQWNTSPRSSVVLPTPNTLWEELLHLADYLASRKDIEIKL